MQEKSMGGYLKEAIRKGVAREQNAHTENDVLASATGSKIVLNTFGHTPRRRLDETLLGYLKDLTGCKVLDCGCGRAGLVFFFPALLWVGNWFGYGDCTVLKAVKNKGEL